MSRTARCCCGDMAITFSGEPQRVPGVVGVAVGCFVDADFPKPDQEIQTLYRHRWLGPLEGAEPFEKFPGPPLEQS